MYYSHGSTFILIHLLYMIYPELNHNKQEAFYITHGFPIKEHGLI